MTKRLPVNPENGSTGSRTYLNGRAILLVILFLVLIFSTAIPFKNYLDQRARINELQSVQDSNQARIDELQNQVERWKDPAYVKAQARNRLHYVMPNEVGYIVLEADDAQAVIQTQTEEIGTRPAWYRTLWASMNDAADTAPPLLKEVGGK